MFLTIEIIYFVRETKVHRPGGSSGDEKLLSGVSDFWTENSRLCPIPKFSFNVSYFLCLPFKLDEILGGKWPTRLNSIKFKRLTT